MVVNEETQRRSLKREHSTELLAPFRKRPTLVQRAAAFTCDALDSYLSWWSGKKGQLFLEGAFAPVAEGELVEDLPVEGELPVCLNGEYVRNGPNPNFPPLGGYHWFDGDGMLHGVCIKDGKASYVNRLVKTSRLQQEAFYGAPKFIKIGDMSGWVGIAKMLCEKLRAAAGLIDMTHGSGTGNTALVYHSGRLLALHEGDAPYAVKVMADGQLETVGRMTYNDSLGHAFTAHPKLDPDTGEMFTFGYNVESQPYLTYRVVSADGVLGPPIPITIPAPVMMHDFAITANHALFLDLPLLFKGEEIVKSGFPFKFDPQQPARFGVLPRYAASEAFMKWFDLPAHYIFHTANAWEEGEEVVLYGAHIPHMDLSQVAVDAQEEKHVSTLHEYRFNLATGKASMRQMADFFSDFPRINEAYVGRKHKYVYCAVMKVTKVVGVAKYDLTKEPELGAGNQPRVGGCCVGYFAHGESRFGSEPVFVSKGEGRSGEEDDGYLLNFVHDEATGKSEMVVIDASTMNSHPVAVVKLPRRVPYGFHGIFVSEAQLAVQKTEELSSLAKPEGALAKEPLLAK